MSDDVAGPPRYTTTTLKNLLEQHDLQMPVARLRDGDGKKDGSWEDSFDSTAAFLSPNLWDKSITYQDEFKMEYVDLDDLFNENGISVPTSNTTTDLAVMKPTPPQHQQQQQPQHPQHHQHQQQQQQQHHHHQPHHHFQHHQPTQSQGASAPPVEKPSAQPAVHSPPLPAPPSLPSPPAQQSLPPFEKAMEIKSALASLPGHDNFDPQSHTFSEEELKPQPMVKKSRKQFVPDDMKDDRYWARRRKNNLAAKRSRDARRVKENQIALRASFLEKENLNLRKELDTMRKENTALKDRIAKIETTC